MVETIPPLLPPEDLASQLSTIEVLLSIYNGSSDLIQEESGGDEKEDDINLSTESYKAIQDLAKFLSLPLEALGKAPSIALRDGLPSIIQLEIKLDPLRGTLDDEDTDRSNTGKRHLLLNIGLVLRRLHQVDDDFNLIRPRWNLKQADWLDRSAYDALCQAARSIEWQEDDNVGYIMNMIEVLSEASLQYMRTSKVNTNGDDSIDTKQNLIKSPLEELVVRTWHLFPSLSMKDKRKDLITYASKYNLTGFVLAGKPGLVAVEHRMHGNTSENAINTIDSYWSDIKTTSWSDLPSEHKKVIERHREVGVKRCFTSMQDVTSLEEICGTSQIIENGRVRKTDLDKTKTWLQSQGCTGQLDIVLGKE